MSDLSPIPQGNSIRDRIWRVIFLADTRSGRWFDIALLLLISCSVVVIMLESVESYAEQYGSLFFGLEWFFTVVFTVEYVLRIWVVRRKRRYIFSFFGIVDFLSIIPTYLELFLDGSHFLMVVRVLRLLRMFRILKMARHMGQANVLVNALRASQEKIAVFIFSVLAIVSIQGTLMYLIEGHVEGSGFTSIPQAVYWGIVTITTVGYGDISPITVPGKMLASVMMLTGFAIIAVPTGIVTAELHREMKAVRMDTRECPDCGLVGHDPKARFCKHCGHAL